MSLLFAFSSTWIFVAFTNNKCRVCKYFRIRTREAIKWEVLFPEMYWSTQKASRNEHVSPEGIHSFLSVDEKIVCKIIWMTALLMRHTKSLWYFYLMELLAFIFTQHISKFMTAEPCFSTAGLRTRSSAWQSFICPKTFYYQRFFLS